MKRKRPAPARPTLPTRAERQARLDAVRASLPTADERRARMEGARASLPSDDARRARMEAVRDKQARTKEQLQARIANRSPDKRSPVPRRRWWLLAILLLLLLLLLRDCSCTDEPPSVEGEAPPVAAADPGELPFIGPPSPPPPPRIERRDRPDYQPPPPKPMPWVAEFRMQVAARGPRLAECFVGSDRPGRLKWTTSVYPIDGTVSDHALEPMLLTRELSRPERLCVTGVLSDPPYRFSKVIKRATPSRVGIVIEF